ncbi:efflux RND transporter periplasmic adaptor subunit [Anaeromyxobacter paludicola]|uniref:Acriflavin resistance protein n=1 Tax=Anaeromyxobacter paludicola TaxID=2918171 RepID=A0ABM7XEN1_9BACT|nr:efflux RND transporter periplasmic adaptor subunit [Anaeromyxobacter paludicola]BDG10341.1 acriflavin resistance protein [Anaeromyxobacter paludicola]
MKTIVPATPAAVRASLARPVAALALLLAWVAPAIPLAAPAGAPAPRPVRLVSSERPGAGRWVAGSLAAERRATLSTRLAAQVRQVAVEEGQRVRKGQLLVRLDDADLRGQCRAAETALAAARAQESRMQRLEAERAATRSELELAASQRAQAEAAVTAARASLGYTEIRAPFDGTVQARRVQAGDLVGPGQPLVELEAGGLEVQVTLSEEEAAGLRIGTRLRFQADGKDGRALVTGLATGADPLSHRRSLRARVVEGAAGLASGAFARVELPAAGGPAAAARAGLWVPRSAVVERGDLTGVFVLDRGRAELRWLAVGEAAGDRIPVRAGLAPGEQVIDAPGPLKDGEPVEVAP